MAENNVQKKQRYKQLLKFGDLIWFDDRGVDLLLFISDYFMNAFIKV